MKKLIFLLLLSSSALGQDSSKTFLDFGLVKSNQDSSASNVSKFNDLWTTVPYAGVGYAGREMYVPSGNYYINPFDGSASQPKFSNLLGDGQRKTQLWLNDGEFLFKSHNWWFNSGIRDIGFYGDGSNSQPLVSLRAVYNFDLYRTHFKNSGSDGLYIGGGTANELSLIDVESENNIGWGIDLDGTLHSNLFGVSVEGNGIGGLLIRSTNHGHWRENAYANIWGVYAEDSPTGIEIRGAKGVTVFNGYHTNGKFVKITTDTTTTGQYSSGNVIYAYDKSVEIEKGNYPNFIKTMPGSSILDFDGKNSIEAFGRPGTEVAISTNWLCDTYLGTTLMQSVGADSGIFKLGSVLSPQLSYSDSKGFFGYLEVIPKNNPYMVFDFTIADSVFYIYLLLQAEANATISLNLYDISNPPYFYNFIDEVWTITSGSIGVVPTGELQYHRFKAKGIIGNTIRGRLYFGHWPDDFPMSPKSKIYYVNVSSDPECGLIHKRNGEVIGYGFDQAVFNNSNLPPADKFVAGTQIWNSQVDSLQVSNGQVWLNR